MILPLKELIRETGNMYILTCAAIKRVLQLSVAGDEEVHKNHGKIVSVAIKQILEKRIEYKLEE
ncbi:MAG: DNA-directed RNA polymerase subunit omega [Spirochaetales bacterium]|nr:DNA-directed RNA polymerase subunit omega [Spirochaetales bacterium]